MAQWDWEVQDRGSRTRMPGEVATEAQRTRSGERRGDSLKGLGRFRIETLGQDWFGLIPLVKSVSHLFTGRYEPLR